VRRESRFRGLSLVWVYAPAFVAGNDFLSAFEVPGRGNHNATHNKNIILMIIICGSGIITISIDLSRLQEPPP